MEDYFVYIIQPVSDTAEDTAEFSDILKKVGITVELSNVNDNTLLSFRVDQEKFEKVVNRNAGRPVKDLHAHKTKDVFVYAREHTMKETAEYCGISLRTCQRRIKRQTERGTWNEESDTWFGET